MKWLFAEFLGCLIICQVHAAPTNSLTDKQADSIEEELIRHHHAILDGNKSTRVTSDADSSTETDQIFESMSHDPNIQPINENELYDITVGDVIRDVLLTLRDNPEIVKELIASEKAKLAEQIEAYNEQIDDTNGEELSQDRLLPSDNQNDAELTADDKSAGLSQTGDIPQINEKRADEVNNDAFTGEDEAEDTSQFMQFMDRPVEGGQNMPMLNYDKIPADDNAESNNMDTAQIPSHDSESETLETDSEDLNERKFRVAYQLPFLNQLSLFRNYGSPNAGGSTSDRPVDSHVVTESHDSDGVDGLNSEEELAWLLQKGRTSRADEQNNRNDEDPRKN